MSILKVARMGHPVLRQVCRRLEPSEIRSPKIQKLIDDMLETMGEYQGIGLAGPQVHEGVRLFVAGYDTDEEEDENREHHFPQMAIVNPEITLVDKTIVEDWEGCLSIPDIRGKVPRARGISLRAHDRHGKRIEIDARGYIARVIQHETDHLDGVLFFDRMTSMETLTFMDEFGRYWSHDAVPPE